MASPVGDGAHGLKEGVRRITTGVDANGRAVVVRDEIVTQDERSILLWGTDTAPSSPADGTVASMSGWWPPPGGVRVSLSTRAPEQESARVDKAPRPWPDINDAAGFHASASVDVIIMISGVIWLELDDGHEVKLGQGDVLVQNGTRHRWHNHSDEWPLMAVVIVGAERPGHRT